VKICPQCNITFYQKTNQKLSRHRQQKYCSNECKLNALKEYNKGKIAHNNNQQERTCIWCGKKDMVSPSYSKKPYCSRNCMTNHYKSGIMKGENHWNWQGGITEKESRDVLYEGYKEFRRKVFQRDDYKCKYCGNNKSGQIVVHHIIELSKNKELATDISNGITLCVDCHFFVHYGYYKDKTDKKQLKLF